CTILLLLCTLFSWFYSLAEKPGLCPKDLLPCKELCHGDNSCPHGQKCCSTGCGHMCQGNIEGGRVGHCPLVLQSHCIMGCKTDENCPHGEKCCKSDCGQVCVAPILTQNSTQTPEGEPAAQNFTETPIPEILPGELSLHVPRFIY
uniref:WAP domain-containing protein n=1 Tax=Vombatus ursinus TaxID=29139 RepID=A0A4X2LBR0_VOMUR